MKVKALHEVTCEWVPGGYAQPGEVYEVPEAQPDGSPLVWSPDFFEPVGAESAATFEALLAPASVEPETPAESPPDSSSGSADGAQDEE